MQHYIRKLPLNAIIISCKARATVVQRKDEKERRKEETGRNATIWMLTVLEVQQKQQQPLHLCRAFSSIWLQKWTSCILDGSQRRWTTYS